MTKAATLRGPTLGAEFKQIVVDYIERRWGTKGTGAVEIVERLWGIVPLNGVEFLRPKVHHSICI